MPPQPHDGDAGRKRRVHRKSRRGCRNCKLRRVKCDEAKPQCANCVNFGVACNFDLGAGDLAPSSGEAFTVSQEQMTVVFPEVINKSIALPQIMIDGVEMDRENLDRLYRFQTRTAQYIGTHEGIEIYGKEIPRLAFAHPYLMHVVQTLTAIHDRYLSTNPDYPSTAELQHWSLAASKFNQKLSYPIRPDDYDALWATAALLGVIAFSSTSASSPEEAWPLKEGSTMMEWLALTEGKKTIWKLATPLGKDSVFLRMFKKSNAHIPFFVQRKCAIKDVPVAWANLFDIAVPDSPYLDAVLLLIPMMKMDYSRASTPIFFSFVAAIKKELKDLLEQNDPRALLLVGFWYAIICDTQWWINRRAKLECQSVCLYLERYHGDDEAIQEQLKFPRSRCGLDTGLLTPISDS